MANGCVASGRLDRFDAALRDVVHAHADGGLCRTCACAAVSDLLRRVFVDYLENANDSQFAMIRDIAFKTIGTRFTLAAHAETRQEAIRTIESPAADLVQG